MMSAGVGGGLERTAGQRGGERGSPGIRQDVSQQMSRDVSRVGLFLQRVRPATWLGRSVLLLLLVARFLSSTRKRRPWEPSALPGPAALFKDSDH